MNGCQGAEGKVSGCRNFVARGDANDGMPGAGVRPVRR